MKYVLSTMGVSKESISKFLIGNRFHVKLRILSHKNCKQSLQVKSWKAEVTAEKKQTQDNCMQIKVKALKMSKLCWNDVLVKTTMLKCESSQSYESKAKQGWFFEAFQQISNLQLATRFSGFGHPLRILKNFLTFELVKWSFISVAPL